MGASDQRSDGGSRAARVGDEGVAGMNDPVLDLRLEQLELAAIEAESIGCPSHEGAELLHKGLG